MSLVRVGRLLVLSGAAGLLAFWLLARPRTVDRAGRVLARWLGALPEPVVVGGVALFAVALWIVVVRSLLVLLYRGWRAIADRVYRALTLVLPESPLVKFAAGATVMILAVVVIMAVLPPLIGSLSAGGTGSYADRLSPRALNAEWDEIVDINLTGQYNICRIVGPRMYEREEGAIVNISSGAGQRGSVSGGVHYSASKAGIFGLTKGLAKQLSPHVRVNCVVPGLIDTAAGSNGDEAGGLWTEEGLDRMQRLILLQRSGRPEEVAAAVAFLASEEASYITGTTLDVDGGASLMPTKEFLMPDSEE